MVVILSFQRTLAPSLFLLPTCSSFLPFSLQAYFTRLGLWGRGAGFDSFKSFESSVSKRGIGAFELLAMELKGIGCYVSRGLSYASCEYIYVSADLDEAQEAVYDAAARFWLDLREAYAHALSLTGSENSEWKIFWSTHQRFFGALCSSAKIATIVQGSRFCHYVCAP